MNKVFLKAYLYVLSYLNPVYFVLDKTAHTILDVGCGTGINSKLLKMRNPNFKIVGIEIHDASIKTARKNSIFSKVIKKDVKKGLIAGSKFDVVICLQVLEHLSKRHAQKLISNLEKSATKQVIITTPLGTLKQGNVGGNIWQTHKSDFTVTDFASRGYITKKLGSRYFSSQEGIQFGSANRISKIVLLFVDVLLTPIYWVVPNLADHYLIAWKKI